MFWYGIISAVLFDINHQCDWIGALGSVLMIFLLKELSGEKILEHNNVQHVSINIQLPFTKQSKLLNKGGDEWVLGFIDLA